MTELTDPPTALPTSVYHDAEVELFVDAACINAAAVVPHQQNEEGPFSFFFYYKGDSFCLREYAQFKADAAFCHSLRYAMFTVLVNESLKGWLWRTCILQLEMAGISENFTLTKN